MMKRDGAPVNSFPPLKPDDKIFIQSYSAPETSSCHQLPHTRHYVIPELSNAHWKASTQFKLSYTKIGVYSSDFGSDIHDPTSSQSLFCLSGEQAATPPGDIGPISVHIWNRDFWCSLRHENSTSVLIYPRVFKHRYMLVFYCTPSSGCYLCSKKITRILDPQGTLTKTKWVKFIVPSLSHQCISRTDSLAEILDFIGGKKPNGKEKLTHSFWATVYPLNKWCSSKI